MARRLSKGVVVGVLLGLVPFVFTALGSDGIIREIGGVCTRTDFVALMCGIMAVICGFNGMRTSRREDLAFNVPLGLLAIGLGFYQFLLGGGVFGCPASATLAAIAGY